MARRWPPEIEGNGAESVATELLALISAGMAAAGWAEAKAHRRALQAVPRRVHVNGTRGKTSVTRAVAAIFRELGQKTVAKCTGTAPVVIGPDGLEHRLARRGRARVHEQVRFLRWAAQLQADVAVVECMAVSPPLQWVCEHQLVRSHIGVITNVRPDHGEEMGRSLEETARCLANTIPRRGVLVTAERRYAPLFEEIAARLQSRVVVVGEDEVGRAAALWHASGPRYDGPRLRAAEFGGTSREPAGDRGALRGPDAWPAAADKGAAETLPAALAALQNTYDQFHAENVALACRTVQEAGYDEETVWRAAQALPRPTLPTLALAGPQGVPGAASGIGGASRVLVPLWSMNDAESFRSMVAAAGDAPVVVVYNHRADRPLRAVMFGQVLAHADNVLRVVVAGDAGGERLLRAGGVGPERLRRLPGRLSGAAVADAVRDMTGPLVILGCGNARSVEPGLLQAEWPSA